MIEVIRDSHPALGILALGLSSLVEYVFPPFPGDTVTLAGAVLVGAYDFPVVPVFLAVLAGSTLGAAADFWVGRAVARGAGQRLRRMWVVREAIAHADRFAKAFARYGEGVIAINRFLPGIRAFLFVAAGMGGMRFGRVMLWATLSNVAYNAAILLAGIAVGTNIDRLKSWVHEAGVASWILMGVLAAALVARWIWKRRRHRHTP